MNKIFNRPVSLIVSGISLLSAGLLYYLIFREVDKTYLIYLPGIKWLISRYPDLPAFDYFFYLGGFPSFIHLLALTLLSAGILRVRADRILLISSFWFLINILFEIGQQYPEFISSLFPEKNWRVLEILRNYFNYGTFDWFDILGLVVAFFVINLAAHIPALRNQTVVDKKQRITGISQALGGVLAATTGIVCLMGSGSFYCREDNHSCYDYNRTYYEPVYLSYADLRQTVTLNNDVPLQNIGKIYLYKQYLLINSRNQGVHIYDNTDTTNPVHLTFINIPGNLDIAVKNDYLYADSYIDLVVIDLSDATNIREISRIEDVFPFDPYQNIPDGIYLGNIDSRQGVIIDYKEKSK